MHINIPRDVKKIIEILNKAGYEAYAVGGCVRDSILGRVPGDWDITTAAKPNEIKSLFRRTIDTGIEHGTVTVRMSGSSYEVTTYRIDGEYEDSRHPKEVTYTASLTEDLKRRDFTINAMAYSDDKGLVDIYGGLSDIEKRIIRCVGSPSERFTEDALRILRAIRFSAQLGFSIDTDTWECICALGKRLKNISKERIYVELNKTLLSDNPKYIKLIYDARIAEYMAKDLINIKLIEKLEDIKKLKKERHIRWAAFSSESSEDILRSVLLELKSDNDTKDKACILVRELKNKMPNAKADIRRMLSRYGEGIVRELLELKGLGFGLYKESSKEVEKISQLVDVIITRGDCISLKTMAIKGEDLIAMGYKPGRELGVILSKLFDIVLENPEYNTKTKLKEYI